MIKHLVTLVCCLLLLGPAQREWSVNASYAAVSYWNNSACSGPAAYTQAYARDYCFDFYDSDGHVRSNLNTHVNATHVAQYYYDTIDCSGAFNDSRTFVAPIGLCVSGPTPYGNTMYQISFFADTAGPYSTTPEPSWSFWSYDSCDSDYIINNQIDNSDYCWNMGKPTFSWKEASCDEDFFYYLIYTTPDCSGPYSVNTSLNRPDACMDDYTNLVGESARIKCTQETKLSCEGSVDIIPRTGNGASWVADNDTYNMFDIVVKNSGDCSIVSAIFPYTIEGNITQSWGLYAGEEGAVVTLSTPILPGKVYESVGMIVQNYKSHTPIESKTAPFICSCDNNHNNAKHHE